MKKILTLMLTVLMVFGCASLLACGGGDTTTTDGGDTVVPSGNTLAAALVSGNYTLIGPTRFTEEENSACTMIEKAINELVDKKIAVSDDYVKRGQTVPSANLEILVGETNRAASKAALETLSTNRKNIDRDWLIQMKNKEVVIVGGSGEGTLEAAKVFVEMVKKAASEYSLETYDSGIQEYAWSVVQLGGITLGDYTVVLPKAASKELQTAAAELVEKIYAASGFRLEIVDDTTAQGSAELIIGETSRAVSTAAWNALKENRVNSAYDSTIHADGTKVALHGGSQNAILNTLTVFAETYLKADKQASVANLKTILEKADVAQLKIDDTDLGSYKIVHKEGADFDTRYIAWMLQQFFYNECGYFIDVITDKTAASGKEILLGATNRGASTVATLNAYSAKVDANGNLILDAGHYTGLAKAYDGLIAMLEAQTGKTLNIAKTYTAAGNVTDIALTWDAGASKWDGTSASAMGLSGKTYTLVWGDEFNGTKLNYEKWSGLANMSMPGTTLSFDEDIVVVKDGQLIMKTDVVDKEARTYISNYSVTTHDTMNWSGGYLEMKAKIPFKGMGEWPSFWSSSANAVLHKQAYRDAHDGVLYDAGYTVEVDFFEQFSTKDTVVPNLHKWFTWDVRQAYGAPNRVQLSGVDNGAVTSGTRTYRFKSAGGKTGQEIANEWHTHGFLWTEDYMAFSVDGTFYYSYRLKDEDQKGNMGTHFNPTYNKTSEEKTYEEYPDSYKANMDGYTYENMALAIILNDMFFPEAYCESADGAWASGNSVKAKNDDVFFPLMYYVEYMRLYQTEGDFLYTPDVIGEGTKMYDKTRFDEALNGPKTPVA